MHTDLFCLSWANARGDTTINKNEFPTREEFYETIIRLKKEREKRRESIYLAYLKEQKFRQKPRRKKGYNEGI